MNDLQIKLNKKVSKFCFNVGKYSAICYAKTFSCKTYKQAVRKERLANNPQGLANSLRGMGTGAQPSWWNELAKPTNACPFNEWRIG